MWLANLLTDLPEIGRIYLLVRRNQGKHGPRAFPRVVGRIARYLSGLQRSMARISQLSCNERIEVVEGDVSKPGLGLAPECAPAPIAKTLDVIVNSSGLTDFNPDLRDALATNVRSTAYTARFRSRLPSRGSAASFHVLRDRPARRARPRRASVELHAGWPREFRR